MGLKKHGITSETIKNMILGAGVIYKNLKYESASNGWTGTPLGATSGGLKFNYEAQWLDIEVDGATVLIKGVSKQKVGESATLSGYGTERFDECCNRRYGNPYNYLDTAISRGKLDATVRTVLKQDNEDKQWDLYCAITANPLADDVGNFEEFKQRFMSTAPKVEKTEQTEPTMNNAQIKLQVEKANKILNGFVPPLKGGG